MKFLLLADAPEAAPTIAKWYFDEWASQNSSATIDSVLKTVSESTGRHSAPMIIAAKISDQYVAAAELKLYEMPQYPDYKFWIGGVYVVPEFRGKGVGSAIVRKTVEQAKLAGIRTLYLQTEYLSGGIYSDLGFYTVEYALNGGKNVLVMATSLDQCV